MKIVAGSDHAGFELKEQVADFVRELVRAYLSAKFTDEERHVRRIAKTRALEERY